MEGREAAAYNVIAQTTVTGEPLCFLYVDLKE